MYHQPLDRLLQARNLRYVFSLDLLAGEQRSGHRVQPQREREERERVGEKGSRRLARLEEVPEKDGHYVERGV